MASGGKWQVPGAWPLRVPLGTAGGRLLFVVHTPLLLAVVVQPTASLLLFCFFLFEHGSTAQGSTFGCSSQRALASTHVGGSKLNLRRTAGGLVLMGGHD